MKLNMNKVAWWCVISNLSRNADSGQIAGYYKTYKTPALQLLYTG